MRLEKQLRAAEAEFIRLAKAASPSSRKKARRLFEQQKADVPEPYNSRIEKVLRKAGC